MSHLKQKETDSPVVAVAELRNYTKNQEAISNRHAPLIEALGEHGVQAVLLNGSKDRSGEDGIFNRYFTLSDSRVESHDASIAVAAAYDLSGGIGKYTPEVAALNPRSLREIARSKEQQYAVLHALLPENVASTEIVLATENSIKAGLDRIQTEKVILKANTDVAKKYPMLHGTKREIIQQLHVFLAAVPPEEKVLVQEYLEETEAAFHSNLRFFDASDAELTAQTKEYKRELRAHVIDDEVIAVHGKVGLQRESGSLNDERVYFAPDSIPPRALSLASAAARLLRETADVNDAYLAVDMTPDAARIIEVNGRNIGTIRPNAHRPGEQSAHEITTEALAEKLADIAKRKERTDV